jgi:dTDP-4-amino-4,6-dideoxygalactose transaminase
VILEAGQISATPDALKTVETELLQGVEGEAMLWCGRATTGLYWAYRGILSRFPGSNLQPEVILPAIACTVLADCARLAGFRPRFADVDPLTGLATLETIQRCFTPQTRAVVFVHLFGQTADLSALAAWCQHHELTLIEDIAHALGAQLPNGLPVGSVAEASIYSFNPTKILESGGGALLIRTPELLSAVKQAIAAQPPKTAVGPALDLALDPNSNRLLELSYRDLYRSMATLGRLGSNANLPTIFPQLTPAYE